MNRARRLVPWLALGLHVAACTAGGATQASPASPFLADQSSDPSFEFLGETYLLHNAAEDGGTVSRPA